MPEITFDEDERRYEIKDELDLINEQLSDLTIESDSKDSELSDLKSELEEVEKKKEKVQQIEEIKGLEEQKESYESGGYDADDDDDTLSGNRNYIESKIIDIYSNFQTIKSSVSSDLKNVKTSYEDIDNEELSDKIDSLGRNFVEGQFGSIKLELKELNLEISKRLLNLENNLLDSSSTIEDSINGIDGGGGIADGIGRGIKGGLIGGLLGRILGKTANRLLPRLGLGYLLRDQSKKNQKIKPFREKGKKVLSKVKKKANKRILKKVSSKLSVKFSSKLAKIAGFSLTGVGAVVAIGLFAYDLASIAVFAYEIRNIVKRLKELTPEEWKTLVLNNLSTELVEENGWDEDYLDFILSLPEMAEDLNYIELGWYIYGMGIEALDVLAYPYELSDNRSISTQKQYGRDRRNWWRRNTIDFFKTNFLGYEEESLILEDNKNRGGAKNISTVVANDSQYHDDIYSVFNKNDGVISVKGNENGKLSTEFLDPIDEEGRMLHKVAAGNYKAMVADAKKDGHTIELSGDISAYRTFEEQVYLKKLELSGKGNLAAKPGTSTHGLGLSVDIKTKAYPGTFEWLQKNASKYGFYNDVEKEPHHWTYVERDDINDKLYTSNEIDRSKTIENLNENNTYHNLSPTQRLDILSEIDQPPQISSSFNQDIIIPNQNYSPYQVNVSKEYTSEKTKTEKKVSTETEKTEKIKESPPIVPIIVNYSNNSEANYNNNSTIIPNNISKSQKLH